MHIEESRSFLSAKETKASLALCLAQKAFQSDNHHLQLEKYFFFTARIDEADTLM